MFTKSLQKKTYKQRDTEDTKGKKAYRLRKQIQEEQQKEIKDYGKKV